MREISIGDLSRRASVKIPTIRYYESIGLMPDVPRSEGKQRRYDGDAVIRLNFIRHARELGFEVEAIRELLDLSGEAERSCAEVDEIARRHLIAVSRRIAQLRALESELERMVTACSHGTVGDCQVLETLNDHGQCLAADHRA